MRYLLIILSSFCFVAASAQKIRFTDSTNRWYGVNFDGNGFPYDFVAFYDSDTVINGNTYLYMESGFVGSEIYVREDTVAAKVFVYAPVFFQDTSEHVLYDYSLQLNDTVINTNQQDTDRYYVSMIDSTQINNVWHKVWRLNNITSGLPPYYDVVEGMGCTLAPWFPMYSSTFENTIMLYCFYNNNTKPFIPSPASIPDWYFHNTRLNCYTGIEDINVSSATLVVSPNPLTATSQLSFGKSGSYKVTIYNGWGQVVVSEWVNDKDVYPIGKYIELPGLYYYKVIDLDNKRTYTGKLVMP